MVLGLHSANVMIASSASLRVSLSLWDFATVPKTGRMWVANASLKTRTVFGVPSNFVSTEFSCSWSALSASDLSTLQKSLMSGVQPSLSDFSSRKPMNSQNMHAVLAFSTSLASAKQVLRMWTVCSALHSRTCQMLVTSSDTIHIASARRPASLDASRISRISMGISSGQASTFCGRRLLSISMSWLPRLCTMSASFLRTLPFCSASNSCNSRALHSAWAVAPSFAHVESSSLTLPRHCLNSTAACSHRAPSSCASASTWNRAATVGPACCVLASV
mmetsp:Transcript_37674/g.106432  ORF Transcript_37674/g.106432 Transcript_37674/m.106432 type:complete len:276 (+) Transcript_37674:1625-2452(+)